MRHHCNGWTDERAALLKKLWSDGLTASQVAARLGGISRSAVIGKLHRMGASGTAPQYKPRSTHNGLPKRKRLPCPPRAKRYTSEAAIAERAALNELAAERQAVQLGPDLVVPPHERKGLLDLEAGDCRWPFSDPKSPDFHFCNGKAVEGAPYCEFHCKRAYAPAQPSGRGAPGRPRPYVSRNLGLTKEAGLAHAHPVDVRSFEILEIDAMERA